ncbi:pentatricopeptide repeat-containing protein [Cocos nucifera]|nr:pentatricopeptide repeat-containing protein [Cocos nucifera]
MLRRRRVCSLALDLFHFPLRFSSNPNPKTLKTLARKSPQIQKSNALINSSGRFGDRRVPAAGPRSRYYPVPVPLPEEPSKPDVESICSLLSEPSNRSKDLDFLLEEFKHKLSSDFVLEILKKHRTLGKSKTLEFFSWAGFQLGFRFDDPVVDYMADFLGRRKLFDDLKWLLKTVSSNKGRVSTRTFSICIRFLGRQGRVVEALALFETMESEFNCSPDNLIFNNVLYVLCRKDSSGGFIDVAITIFRRIGHPDVHSYSNLIVGLCRFGRLANALEVFHQMSLANLAPTRNASNILIRQLCELGGRNQLIEKVKVKDWRRPFDILVPNMWVKSGIETAVEVLWAITKLGLLPSSHVVNGLVSELCRLGNVEEAIEILKMAENRKMRSIDESYTIVIKVLCGLRRMDEACNLFGRMIFLGLKPKLIVYNSIIHSFCKLGNVAEAQVYFDIMNKRRCEPDCATYTMLIHANCANGKWEAAYELLMEMVGLGWNPHFGTYNLVNGFLKEYGRLDLSQKLERKMEVENLHAYCKAGRLEAAYDKLSSMVAKGFYPPVYARDAFEQAFRRSGKWKIAQELLASLDQIVSKNISQA